MHEIQDKLQLVYDRKNMINVALTIFMGGITGLIPIMIDQVRVNGSPTVGAGVFLFLLSFLLAGFIIIRYYYYNCVQFKERET